MASASLTLYRNNTQSTVFGLASQYVNGAEYKVTGRDLSIPYKITVERNLTSGNSVSNDRVSVRISRVERNATTGKPATASVTLLVSIPKDTSVLTQTVQKELLAQMCSLLNDNVAVGTTTVNTSNIVSGSDL